MQPHRVQGGVSSAAKRRHAADRAPGAHSDTQTRLVVNLAQDRQRGEAGPDVRQLAVKGKLQDGPAQRRLVERHSCGGGERALQFWHYKRREGGGGVSDMQTFANDRRQEGKR